jgi:hypothetical protein
MDRQELIDEAIKVTKDTIMFCDDWTALDKLMAFVPTERLKEFLPVGEQDQTIEQLEAAQEAQAREARAKHLGDFVCGKYQEAQEVEAFSWMAAQADKAQAQADKARADKARADKYQEFLEEAKAQLNAKLARELTLAVEARAREVRAKAHKIRSKLLKADALVISLIRNPEASLEDIKKARESLLRMDKKAAEVERLIYTSNITKLNILRRTSND